MKANYFLLYILLLFLPTAAFADTNFPQLNIAYKYDPNALIQCKHQLAAHQDSMHVYLEIKVNEGDLLQDYTFGYELKQNYSEKSEIVADSLNVQDHLITSEGKFYYLKIPLFVEGGVQLMVVSISSINNQFYFDIPLNMPNSFIPPNLLLVDGVTNIPIFKEYINPKDSIRFLKVFGEQDSTTVYFYKYKHDFKPALPPMATSGDGISKSMEIDSVFSGTVGSNLNLSDEALYFVQTDTTGPQGIAFRVVDPYFPAFVKAGPLIEPLIYISTKSEYSRLLKASDTKKALDKYWLELIKTPSRAKVIISRFYKSIEAANYAFTSYKEGWKTDQGMIYALYGIPDQVYYNGEEEQWIYQKDEENQRVKFTFVKIRNIFTDQHFELMRSKNYEKYWFGNVELWRKGIKDI